jgi:hypothetical protein
MGDTLTYSASPTAVDDDRRKGIAQMLRIGLVRLVARASGHSALSISFGGRTTRRIGRRLAIAGISGCSRRASTDLATATPTTSFSALEGQLEARRITAGWKTTAQFEGNYNENKYKLEDGSTFANIQRNYDFEFEHVKSVGAHVADRRNRRRGTSTFSNQKRVFKIAPGDRVRRVSLQRGHSARDPVSVRHRFNHYAYEDTTIYLQACAKA